MFLGEYNYKLDEKGRVPVPPKFRGELRDGIILVPGPEKCIIAYTPEEWENSPKICVPVPWRRTKYGN